MQDRDEYFKGISFVRIAFLALFFLGMMVLVGQVRGGEWNEKPVMCAFEKEIEQVLELKGEKLFFVGKQLTKVRTETGLAKKPVGVKLDMYVNPETGTFTIIEFHPTYKSYCVISYGMNFQVFMGGVQ